MILKHVGWSFVVFGSILMSNFLCVHCTQVSDSGPHGPLVVKIISIPDEELFSEAYVGCTASYFVKIIYSHCVCNPHPFIFWGSVLLYLRSPKGGCCSIICLDLSCSWGSCLAGTGIWLNNFKPPLQMLNGILEHEHKHWNHPSVRLSKIEEVPRGIQVEKSRKHGRFGKLVSTIGA